MIKRFDAFMMRFIREHPHRWRAIVCTGYTALLAWYLWDVVHRNPWWGVDLAVAIFLVVIWAKMAHMWGTHDRADEVERLVLDATADQTVAHYAWQWTYVAPVHRQVEILRWMQTHDMAAVHIDDMPPAVRDLAQVVTVLRDQ